MTPKQRLICALERRRPGPAAGDDPSRDGVLLEDVPGRHFPARRSSTVSAWTRSNGSSRIGRTKSARRILRARRRGSRLLRAPLDRQRPVADRWPSPPASEHDDVRYRFVTPKGELSMVLAVQPIHGLGHGTPDQAEVRHRADRRVLPGPQVRRAGGQPPGRGVWRAGNHSRPRLLLRRVRPAGLLAGRGLPGGHRAADPGHLRRSGLGPRTAANPPAPQAHLRAFDEGGGLRPDRVRRRRRLARPSSRRPSSTSSSRPTTRRSSRPRTRPGSASSITPAAA